MHGKEPLPCLRFVIACPGLMLFSMLAFSAPRLSLVSAPPSDLKSLPALAAGRVGASGQYQWPGLYFEARFTGHSVYFTTGPGDVIVHALVDGESAGTLVKPVTGTYLIDGLAGGAHLIRVEAVTESQSAPNTFGGFALAADGKPLPLSRRKRQIEFIGDSHTVGYGNTSPTRDCTSDDVWKTTDSSRAFAATVARHYEADYQVNAISGRGVVRNYDGSGGDPLPVAYPFMLLDHAARYDDAGWHPQVIVIALGTNDFSTPLKAGEKWKTREELHADFEATYVRFVTTLRSRNPQALIVVWATDMAEHEIQNEATKVVTQLQSAGDHRITFLAIHGLAMTGCNWHPSVADDDEIAADLIPTIDSRD
jgi:lysophospholipase L1-like esterase